MLVLWDAMQHALHERHTVEARRLERSPSQESRSAYQEILGRYGFLMGRYIFEVKTAGDIW